MVSQPAPSLIHLGKGVTELLAIAWLNDKRHQAISKDGLLTFYSTQQDNTT